MHDHPHPGELLKEDVLEPLDLSITEASRRLGMSRVALSRLLNGKAGISSDLAVRLKRAGVATARFWMTLQTNDALQQATRREQPPIEPWSSLAASANDHHGAS